MTESSGIENALGAEVDSRDAEAPTAGADAVALALAMQSVHHDPELSRNASEYLAKQRVLVELQVKHFDEERRLSIAAAKRKRYTDRIRNALATIIAIFAAGALVGITVLIFDAIHDHGLLVEAFSVPPDFADKGLTGRIVASDLLEQIDELQSRAQSGRALTTFKNDWGDDIKVAIPETGVSIGEVSRILHDRLGHATRVQGSIVHVNGAVSVVARVSGHPSVRASGPETDLENLIREVALGIFAATQPYRYAVLLLDQDHQTESAAVFRKLAEDGPEEERAWGWNGLGLTEARFEDSLSDFQHALRAEPQMVMATWNIARTAMMVGREEAALAAARAGIEANRGAGRAMLKPYAAQVDDERLKYIVASELGDHTEALKHAQAMMALPRWGGSKQEGREFELLEVVLLHDVPNPLLADMPTDLQETRASNASVERHGRDEGYLSITRLLLSEERGAWREVVADGEELRDTVAREPFLLHVGAQVSRRILPVLALAYEHLGRSAEADALLKQIPNDVYDGWRARARVALLRHDYPLAARALTEAARQAPSLPYAYSDWGDLLTANNDIEGAVSKYAEANRRGPHFADPIKAWGDVLAKQERWKDALAKYDEALAYAPNWAALKENRASAAKHYH